MWVLKDALLTVLIVQVLVVLKVMERMSESDVNVSERTKL